MLRLRLFRILLPVVLIGVVVLLVWAIQAPPKHEIDRNPGAELQREVTSANVRIYKGFGPGEELRETLRFVAENVEECPGVSADCLRALGVREFKLARKERGDLIVSAETTEVVGPEGQRKMRFEGPVRIEDNDLGLVVDLPYLDVDEFVGVARSQGAIHIKGAGHRTRAERLAYGLAGQATELFRLEMEDDDEGLLLASRAFLHDGIHDVELVQGVRYRRGDGAESMRSERCRIRREEETGEIRNIVAEGSVVAEYLTERGTLEAAGDRIEVNWRASGEIEALTIDGRALIEEGAQFLSADLLDFKSLGQALGWTLDARGSVHFAGATRQGDARVRAESLSAEVDEDFRIIKARADGTVRFESPGTLADAATAHVRRHPEIVGLLEIELLSGDEQRARLAQERSRVAADRILTDNAGHALAASGRVESTLLPQPEDAALDGLFRTDRAVHFISSKLNGGNEGQKLVFEGNVRAWQGDQNLSAQSVHLDIERGTLHAVNRVSTRFPRVGDEGAAPGSEDFIQVTSNSLDYDREARQAIYRETVRVVVAEGWIESDSITVTQNGTEGGFKELLAEGNVRLELSETEDSDGETLPRTTGHSDRLIYVPAERTVRLYGDEQRAEIQRGGDQAGTSQGRVLTYRLDDGTLSVEGGTVKASAPPATVQQRQPNRE